MRGFWVMRTLLPNALPSFLPNLMLSMSPQLPPWHPPAQLSPWEVRQPFSQWVSVVSQSANNVVDGYELASGSSFGDGSDANAWGALDLLGPPESCGNSEEGTLCSSSCASTTYCPSQKNGLVRRRGNRYEARVHAPCATTTNNPPQYKHHTAERQRDRCVVCRRVRLRRHPRRRRLVR